MHFDAWMVGKKEGGEKHFTCLNFTEIYLFWFLLIDIFWVIKKEHIFWYSKMNSRFDDRN